MKTHKWINLSNEFLINEDPESWNEDGAFDDNWIISAQDIFGAVDSSEYPFDYESTIRQAA